MIRALFRGVVRLGRLGVRLGAVAGVFLLITKLLRREPEAEPDGSTSTIRAASPDDPQPEPQTTPPPTATDEAATATATTTGAWVEPENGTCPVTHPVKAKVSSKIFHEPGMLAYERTTPDRCYLDAPSAEADGFRRAKR